MGISIEKEKRVVGINAEIPPELDERIHREFIRRGGRQGQKRMVIIEALEKGLDLIEQTDRQQEAKAS
jgi:hypothetical protein